MLKFIPLEWHPILNGKREPHFTIMETTQPKRKLIKEEKDMSNIQDHLIETDPLVVKRVGEVSTIEKR